MATIAEILRMSVEQRKTAYKATGIDKVIIDGNEFTDYGAFSFLWEKSYVKSPERSGDGTIGNLNSYATFITPHLKIDFSMMSIDSYRRLMQLVYSKNEFIVECYDIINNEITKNKMYFSTEEMPKLLTIARALNGEKWVELLGVQDYTVELIGTNASLDLLSVVYHFNPPDDSGLADTTEEENDVYAGEEIIMGKGSSFPNNPPTNYKFKHWVDSLGTIYTDGYAYTINKNLVLYAVWEATNNHTLVFNYGYSTPMIDTETQEYKTSKTVVTGKSIGALPTFEERPAVTYNDTVYDGENSPYYNGEWWKTAQKVEEGDNDEESLIVRDNDLYWSNYDTTIYLLYDIKAYEVKYYIDGQLNSTLSVKYGETLALPNYVKSGYSFSGWYTDSDYKTSAPTTMPPYAITLYARFVKNQ